MEDNIIFKLVPAARISLLAVFFIGFVFVIYYMVKDKIRIEIGILWILSFIIGSILIIFDDLLYFFTHKIGGKQPSSGLALLAFAFIFLILITFSSYISTLYSRIKNLVQYTALLEKRVREIENKLNKDIKREINSEINNQEKQRT